MNPTNGAFYEKLACTHLEKKGLVLLEKNYRAPCGEIDLIMRDHSISTTTIIFIEVRFRTQTHLGSPLETITLSKIKKIVKTASHFLQKKGWTDQYPCRFDAVAIQYQSGTLQIEWIPHAFEWAY